MRTRKIIIIGIILIVIIATVAYFSVGEEKVQVKHEEVELEDGTFGLAIDGEIYKRYGVNPCVPGAYWFPSDSANKYKVSDNLYFFAADKDKVFAYLRTSRWEVCTDILYVKDAMEFPQFSVEGVDEIGFEYSYNLKNPDNKYYYSSRDKKLIEKVFETLKNYEETDTEFYNETTNNNTRAFVGTIHFYNDGLMGIEVSLQIYAMNNEYWIFLGSGSYHCVLTREFLYEITGIDMPEASRFTRLTIYEQKKIFVDE